MATTVDVSVVLSAPSLVLSAVPRRQALLVHESACKLVQLAALWVSARALCWALLLVLLLAA